MILKIAQESFVFIAFQSFFLNALLILSSLLIILKNLINISYSISQPLNHYLDLGVRFCSSGPHFISVRANALFLPWVYEGSKLYCFSVALSSHWDWIKDSSFVATQDKSSVHTNCSIKDLSWCRFFSRTLSADRQARAEFSFLFRRFLSYASFEMTLRFNKRITR